MLSCTKCHNVSLVVSDTSVKCPESLSQRRTCQYQRFLLFSPSSVKSIKALRFQVSIRSELALAVYQRAAYPGFYVQVTLEISLAWRLNN